MAGNVFSFSIMACVLAVICSVHAEAPLHTNTVSQTASSNIAENANANGMDSQTEVPPTPSDTNSEKIAATETYGGLTEQLNVLTNRVNEAEARLRIQEDLLTNKGESATNKPAEETQKDEIAAIVHDQVIDQVTIIMTLETLAFAVIVALLGWIAQNVVRQRLESEFTKDYKERLKVIED